MVGMARVFLAPEVRLHRQQRVGRERNPNAAECFPCGRLGGALHSQDSSRRKARGAVHAGSSAALGWQAVAAPGRAELEGSRSPSQGSSDGGRDAWQASKTQAPMGPVTRSKVQMETNPWSLLLQVSSSAEGRMGRFGVKGEKGLLRNFFQLCSQ